MDISKDLRNGRTEMSGELVVVSEIIQLLYNVGIGVEEALRQEPLFNHDIGNSSVLIKLDKGVKAGLTRRTVTDLVIPISTMNFGIEDRKTVPKESRVTSIVTCKYTVTLLKTDDVEQLRNGRVVGGARGGSDDAYSIDAQRRVLVSYLNDVLNCSLSLFRGDVNTTLVAHLSMNLCS
jgi:hypothetical protein